MDTVTLTHPDKLAITAVKVGDVNAANKLISVKVSNLECISGIGSV